MRRYEREFNEKLCECKTVSSGLKTWPYKFSHKRETGSIELADIDACWKDRNS